MLPDNGWLAGDGLGCPSKQRCTIWVSHLGKTVEEPAGQPEKRLKNAHVRAVARGLFSMAGEHL